MIKQSSLDDNESLGIELDSIEGADNVEDVVELTEYDERRPAENREKQLYNTFQKRPSTPTQPQITVQKGNQFFRFYKTFNSHCPI